MIMYPGEADGFTLFSGREAEADHSTVWGQTFNAGSGGEICAGLWKRDGTKPGTAGNMGAVLTGIPLGLFILGGD